MGEAPEYGITDQLSYHYRGNQLMAVNDAMDTPEGNASDFRDNGSKGSLQNPEYAYDANGNMTWDGNKGITVEYNHLNLPKKVDFGNNKYIEYTYDATGTKLQQKVHDGQNPVKQTDYVGGMVYEDGQLQFIQHEEGRIVMVDESGLSKFPEYQYHLKDHLGNVRLTFSATPETESNTATLETVHEEEEYAAFLRYAETTKINTTFFDHTNNGDTHYAIRLNGSENERIGLAKSLAVMTGDTVRAEVYAKYLDPDQDNWTAALQNLMAAIAGGTAPTGTVIEAVPPVGGDNFPFEGLLDAAKANDTGTRAYLNILLFDENLTFVDGAFVPVTTAAMENGTNVPHEKLSGEIVVQQPGYAYIYFSNDNGQPLEVFFDDFTVEHVHSAIVQADDYYPFGMTFNEYRREDGMMNRYLYNGKEIQQETGWYDYGQRMYDPEIGRFNRIDRFADKYYPLSPYSFTANNPIKYVDINGDSIYIYSQKDKQSILYHEGNLYWAGTGKTYDGKAYNKKGNLTGFVKQASGALDNIRTGGAAGKELIDYFQNASFKDIRIENGTSNGERSGLISWNPNERNSSIPNQDGSFGRDPFIGLAHEIGHSWDRWENGSANTNSTWYTAADGTNVTQSEKVATWWENRIRAENNVGLREFYSFTNSNGRMQGDAAGRLLIQGTRYSQHNNIFGQQRQIVVGPFGIILNTPYRY